MPNIMIRCTTYGTSVPTGLKTETIVLDSLSEIEVPLLCPACMKIHKWERKDAWVDKMNAVGWGAGARRGVS
jgi:hypothetical protein